MATDDPRWTVGGSWQLELRRFRRLSSACSLIKEIRPARVASDARYFVRSPHPVQRAVTVEDFRSILEHLVFVMVVRHLRSRRRLVAAAAAFSPHEQAVLF